MLKPNAPTLCHIKSAWFRMKLIIFRCYLVLIRKLAFSCLLRVTTENLGTFSTQCGAPLSCIANQAISFLSLSPAHPVYICASLSLRLWGINFPIIEGVLFVAEFFFLLKIYVFAATF